MRLHAENWLTAVQKIDKKPAVKTCFFFGISVKTKTWKNKTRCKLLVVHQVTFSGMVTRWTLRKVKWPQTGGLKGHELNHLVFELFLFSGPFFKVSLVFPLHPCGWPRIEMIGWATDWFPDLRGGRSNRKPSPQRLRRSVFFFEKTGTIFRCKKLAVFVSLGGVIRNFFRKKTPKAMAEFVNSLNFGGPGDDSSDFSTIWPLDLKIEWNGCCFFRS